MLYGKTSLNSMDDYKKHRLGKRAFFVFLVRRIKFSLFLFILAWAAWYAERWLSPEYASVGDYIFRALLLVSVAYFLIIYLITYLEYRYHSYVFTEEAFVVTKGYAVHNETAALYHQIQNVNINRSPLDRVIGVSEIVIFMAGSDRETAHNRIVLPAVQKKKARLVQKEILMRARRCVVAEDEDESPSHKRPG
jgi:membrane protein YdbS with pleckstrin-like domain